MSQLTILCCNISNPSCVRAKQQMKWLENRTEDIFVLTETKDSRGCDFLIDSFTKKGYYVEFHKPYENEYGVIIISRIYISSTRPNNIIPIKSRYKTIVFEYGGSEYELMGVYVPSNDRSKIERKKRFVTALLEYLSQNTKRNRIFCGDLNTIEPSHVPKYKMFRKWEYEFYNKIIDNEFVDAFRFLYPQKNKYSWIGRSGNGYRYDHFFISNNMTTLLLDCFYDAEPVKIGISDHSAIILKFGNKK